MEDERKDFSKMVGTEKGEEARLHIWRDDWGVHATLDFQSEEALDALDRKLSTKCMTEEEYLETIDYLNELIFGEP